MHAIRNCVENKNEVYNKFVDFQTKVRNLFNKGIKRLRCDNGIDYVNYTMKSYLKKKKEIINRNIQSFPLLLVPTNLLQLMKLTR